MTTPVRKATWLRRSTGYGSRMTRMVTKGSSMEGGLDMVMDPSQVSPHSSITVQLLQATDDVASQSRSVQSLRSPLCLIGIVRQ